MRDKPAITFSVSLIIAIIVIVSFNFFGFKLIVDRTANAVLNSSKLEINGD
jgi:hypothetical protein